MSQFNVTYYDIITHASNLRIKFIPWDNCKSGSKLGSGASMNVFDGTYEDNGTIQKAAFKSVNTSLTEKTKESKRSIVLRDIKQEIRIMGRLKGHSRIVQLLAVSFNEYTPILILELAKSNLEDYLQNEHAGWNTKLRFVYDIALGLEAIHKIEVVHGDLKASNILLYDDDNNQMIAKISDFGYSATNLSVQAGRTPGYTPNFRSPESLDPELHDWNGKYTADIYSYGLVVYQIADNGTIPFDDYSEEDIDIMKKEGSEMVVLMENLPEDTPIEVQNVIKATIKSVPSERLRLDEVKNTLKECTEWNQVYSYEEAKIAFETLAQSGPQKSIDIEEMNKLPIPSLLRTSIFHEYQRLADTGDIAALYNLGSCWYYGFGTEKDYVKTVECCKISAEAGNAAAQNYLGWCYLNGLGISKDHTEAVKWYAKGAEAGNTSAQYNLGWFYEYGQGATKDYIRAVEWYTKAAEAGYSKAQNNLGQCYQNGLGVAKDYIKAVEWYIKGAEAGDAFAQNNLGWCYLNGYGVTKDCTKAVEWYTKGAEAGGTSAQFSLGWCYENGQGVTEDYIKAVEWYTKAAEAGYSQAQYNLAGCYDNGRGVAKDYFKAIELYTKAAGAGNNDAPKDIERLRKLVENN